MKVRVFWVFILLCGCAGAYADESGIAAVSSLKVDLDKVVEQGFVSPVDGVTSSGQPTPASLDVFADSGYAAVIDLRGENEDRGFDERDAVEVTGMHYVSLPIENGDAITLENARKLDALIAEHDGPVLIHCGSGNRVGALLALRKSLDGANVEEAIEYGRDAGLTRLEDVVRERLEDD